MPELPDVEGFRRRHGKWVFAPAGEVEVLMHFGMTGLLGWEEGRSERRGRELRYRNMRKFGAVWLSQRREGAGHRAARAGRDGRRSRALPRAARPAARRASAT